MVSHTVCFKGMMIFTLTSQMYHRISVLVPVLVRVPEYLSTSTSTSMSTMTLELMSTSTVRVPEIQYSSTASTEYEYPSPDWYDYVLLRAWPHSPPIVVTFGRITIRVPKGGHARSKIFCIVEIHDGFQVTNCNLLCMLEKFRSRVLCFT